ncbi:MAG: hypothetical protein HWE34_06915 [Methylocystaceae bacterium]|nr:hypothetical protein [Methylocystaceae bacterium]
MNGEFSGTVGETVKYLCEEAGLTCHVEVLPFKRAYQKLENNQVDGLITIKVDRFRECCLSTQWETPWVAGFYSYKAWEDIPDTPTKVLGQRLIVVAGMRSPYEFMPALDKWDQDEKVTLFRANGVKSATKMFLSHRATYLWGSQDFEWYFDKLGGDLNYRFKPLVVRPIVVWFRKDKKHILDQMNLAFEKLRQKNILAPNMLLKSDLMQTRYIDAPFEH